MQSNDEMLDGLKALMAGKKYPQLRLNTSLLVTRDVPKDDLRLCPALAFLAEGRESMCNSLASACRLNSTKHMTDLLDTYSSYAVKGTFEGWSAIAAVRRTLPDAAVQPPTNFSSGVEQSVLDVLVNYDKNTHAFGNLGWDQVGLSKQLVDCCEATKVEIARFDADFTRQVTQLAADAASAPTLDDHPPFKVWKEQIATLKASNIHKSAWWSKACSLDIQSVSAEADFVCEQWEFCSVGDDNLRDLLWEEMNFNQKSVLAAQVAFIKPVVFNDRLDSIKAFLAARLVESAGFQIELLFPDRSAAKLKDIGENVLAQIVPLDAIDSTTIGLIDQATTAISKLVNGPILSKYTHHVEAKMKAALATITETIIDLAKFWWEDLDICSRPCDYKSVNAPRAKVCEPLYAILNKTFEKKNIEAEAIPVYISDFSTMLQNIYNASKVLAESSGLSVAPVYAECLAMSTRANMIADKYKSHMAQLLLLSAWVKTLEHSPEHVPDSVEAVRGAFRVGDKGSKWDYLSSWATWHTRAFAICLFLRRS